MSDRELLRKAWGALLEGDTDERDRLCNILEHRHKQRVRVKEGGPLIVGEPISVTDKAAK